MSVVSMLAGVGLLSVCCLSSSVATTMMGGEKTTSTTMGPTGPAPPSGPPKGRYVKLEHTVAYDESAEGNVDDKNRIINLTELEVFDASGTNLAAGKSLSRGSSEYSAQHLWLHKSDRR